MPLLLIRNIFKNIFFTEDIGLVECDREIVEIDMRELRLILRSYENIEDLNSMKEYVYNDSFRMFCEFYNDIQNIDLGELEFKEFDFSNIVTENDSSKDNIKVLTDLLFEAHYILQDITTGMKLVFMKSELTEFKDILLKVNNGKHNNDFQDNFYSFKNLSLEQQEILKMVFLLAQFVQKVCLNDDVSKDIAVEFKNIISSIEEDLEFQKFRKFY